MSSFDFYVIRNVIANNKFAITSVYNLEEINDLIFDRIQYPEIVKLIISGEVEKIKNLADNIRDPKYLREYLIIMKFYDQKNNQFVITVYDSDALEQDPQIIEIFKLD